MSGEFREIDILHKYFLNADKMRFHFDEMIRSLNAKVPNLGSDEYLNINIYMSLWYSCLYSVVEAWQELNFHDTNVDNLLSDKANVDLLRRYRNATLHYQKEYFHDKTMDFLSQKDSAKWARELHNALSNYFLSNLKK